MESSTQTARIWLRQQSRLGRRGARPVVALGLAGALAAIGQAWCAADVLAAALAGTGLPIWPIVGFAGLALARAGLGAAADMAGFAAAAAARRRLRTEALHRLLAAGPAVLRGRHSGELVSVVVDRVDALEGLFARYIPASVLAVAAPLLVALAVLAVDPVAAAILLGAGLLVPVAMALSGLGAAAASRSQFAALARLQARFLDRVRGIATIVMYGRAEDEAVALGAAAEELRVRTMRVLRVAFLSSVALDLAATLALVILALRAFAGGVADPAVAGRGAVRAAAGAGVLRAAADLRRRLSGSHPRAGRRRAAGRLAAAARAAGAGGDPHRRGARRRRRVRGCPLHLGRGARPGAGRRVASACRRARP